MSEALEYVILKRPDRSVPIPMSHGSRNLESFPEEKLDLFVQSLTEREAIKIKKDPVYTAAPSMPLRLIEPRARVVIKSKEKELPWGLEAIGANASSLNGSGVVLAVLDTGIDRQHKAFSHIDSDNLEERDFTGEGNGDRDGHGTHCAGTIFGSKVDGIKIGIAPNIERALIGKVIGSQGASSATLLSAIQWAADAGAHVISMSLGMDFPGYSMMLAKAGYPIDLATSKALAAYRENINLFDAVGEMIRASGPFRQSTIIIAAAGNASQRDVNPEHTIAVEPPAASNGFISVGAVERIGDNFQIAPFSNTGPNIVAPGVDILSAHAGGGTVIMSGTSMATPHVAGAAALWIQYLQIKKRRPTFDILHAKLMGSALPISDLDQSDVGAGLVQIPSND